VFSDIRILVSGYVLFTTTMVAAAMWIRYLVGVDIPGWRHLYVSFVLFALWHATPLAINWIEISRTVFLGLKFLHPVVAICGVTFMLKGMKFFSNS